MDALEIEQSFRGSHGMLTLHVWQGLGLQV